MQNRKKVVLIVILVIISIFLALLSLMTMFVPRSNSWASSVIQVDKLHELGFDGSGVTIGIVDTGNCRLIIR